MDTVIDLSLNPIFWDDCPEIEICWDQQVLFRGELDHAHIKTFRVVGSPGDHRLNVEFYNKRDGDTVIDQNLDKAVIINNVAFEGMFFDSFMHSARYWPQYPDSYRDTCRQQGIDLEPDIVSNYLGWNGVWTLPVRFPIYTWIHETENLGWIYEKNL
jgi:hypothetical protein